MVGLGDVDGLLDGLELGELLGDEEGDELGLELGELDGEALGLALGLEEGDDPSDGELLGLVLGELDGEDEGDELGDDDGEVLGELDPPAATYSNAPMQGVAALVLPQMSVVTGRYVSLDRSAPCPMAPSSVLAKRKSPAPANVTVTPFWALVEGIAVSDPGPERLLVDPVPQVTALFQLSAQLYTKLFFA